MMAEGLAEWVRERVFVELRNRSIQQSDVAGWLGLSQASVSRMLAPGGRPMRIDEVAVIAERLGLRLMVALGDQVRGFA